MISSREKQVEITRNKLVLLEQTLDEARRLTSWTAHTRELTVRSLEELINQLKEEIARHEAHATVVRKTY
jgi:hypothetical protein